MDGSPGSEIRLKFVRSAVRDDFDPSVRLSPPATLEMGDTLGVGRGAAASSSSDVSAK